MLRFRRATLVDASLEAVWAFHSSIDGLRALTPAVSGLEIGAVTGPDGTESPDPLVVGTEIEMRVRPLGVVPGPGWTSRIAEREREDGSAHFTDVVIDGPLDRWEHTHRFVAVEEGTIVIDALELALPPRLRALAPLVRTALWALFVHRHRRTRTLLAA